MSDHIIQWLLLAVVGLNIIVFMIASNVRSDVGSRKSVIPIVPAQPYTNSSTLVPLRRSGRIVDSEA